MNNKNLDPNLLIDREFEQELFEDLLKLQDEARILSIKDVGGMGKSLLFEKFKYRCQTVKPRIPICLIALDQLDALSPIVLVNEIVKQLTGRFDIKFSKFHRYNSSRVFGDFSSIQSAIYLGGASFDGANSTRMSGLMVNAEHSAQVIVSHNKLHLTHEQDEAAQEMCVRAFLDDLNVCCAEQLIVIMLDAYEVLYRDENRKGSERLREWIEKDLLDRCFFDYDRRPLRLLLVIAGQKAPDYYRNWSSEDCDLIVRSVRALSRWERHHVEACLKIHGFDYSEKDIETFYHLSERGVPPSTIVGLMQSIKTVSSERYSWVSNRITTT